MSGIHVFTSAAVNYLPKVRVLFQTLRKWHPEWKLHFAIADAPPRKSELAWVDGDAVHEISDLKIPEWRSWAFQRSLIEVGTGLKPFALEKLLKIPGCEAVIYLDPDIAVFSPLDEIVGALLQADVVLTPHQTAPDLEYEQIVANEICTAQHGVYNLGFIGVGARDEGIRFARWWRDRVHRFGQEDTLRGIYTDQGWVNFVPAFFDRVRVLRSPALNVAPWNLSTRVLAGSIDRGVSVNGSPLGFFHFSQFDRISALGSRFDCDVARELFEWYRQMTTPLRGEPNSRSPWGLGFFDNGKPISFEQRHVYRLRPDLQSAFPDPYATGGASYYSWWARDALREYPALFDDRARNDERARLGHQLSPPRRPN
jgi:hypothetical protein